jgi:selenocysteine-specific elongation factor
VEVDEIARGSTIVGGDAWAPTTLLLSEVTLLEGVKQTMGPRTRVRFHLGAAEVGGRVVIARASGEASADVGVPARVFLDEPVIARAGDRFVLRGGSPLTTLGGGIVTDPLPSHRRARPFSTVGLTPGKRLRMLAEEAGVSGVEISNLPIRLGLSAAAVDAAIAADSDLFILAGRVFLRSSTNDLAARITDVVSAYHGNHPLDFGVSLQAVRTELRVVPELVDGVIDELVKGGTLEIDRSLLRRAGWTPHLSSEQSEVAKRIAHDICSAKAEPPTVGELVASHGSDVPALLRYLERAGTVIQISTDFYYDSGVVGSVVERIQRNLKPGVEYSPGEFRDLLDLSRKYLIPLLEYCDRRGITERRATGRLVRPRSS